MIETIIKPWGTEKKWAHTAHYVGKILDILPTERLSIQYHNEKIETMIVLKGTGLLCFYGMDEDGELTVTSRKYLDVDDVVHITAKQIHSVEAGSNGLTLMEISTNHLNDLIRLQDKYNRK
jgi:mannose-6-phosphate isomerase-like protein (cupin superfamily)